MTLSNIGNPGVSGNTGTFTITTTDSSGATIDTNATVPSVSIDPGALSSATITPASLVAGASGNVVLAFTMSNPLPKDGKVNVTFPAGFDLTNTPVALNVAKKIKQQLDSKTLVIDLTTHNKNGALNMDKIFKLKNISYNFCGVMGGPVQSDQGILGGIYGGKKNNFLNFTFNRSTKVRLFQLDSQ